MAKTMGYEIHIVWEKVTSKRRVFE